MAHFTTHYVKNKQVKGREKYDFDIINDFFLNFLFLNRLKNSLKLV